MFAWLFVGWGCAPATPGLPSTPGVRTVVDTTYYDAEAFTRGQWLASMRVAAPRAGVRVPYLAHTTWQTRWAYGTPRTTALGCEPRIPVIEVTVHYTMPRLTSDSGVALEDMLEWRRHAASLWQHEEGHGLRALRAATEMRDSLARLRAPNCAALPGTVSRAMNAVMAKYQALQDAYDARTRHGARQGAVLILSQGLRLPLDTTYRDTTP